MLAYIDRFCRSPTLGKRPPQSSKLRHPLNIRVCSFKIGRNIKAALLYTTFFIKGFPFPRIFYYSLLVVQSITNILARKLNSNTIICRAYNKHFGPTRYRIFDHFFLFCVLSLHSNKSLPPSICSDLLGYILMWVSAIDILIDEEGLFE